MRVVIFETEEWEHEACLQVQQRHQIACTREPLNASTVAAYTDAEIVSPFVNSKLSAEVLSALPNLKLVATRSTGYDHIDLDFCKARGIRVSNVPDYGDWTVAEQVFALLLAVARNLVKAVERTRRGIFNQSGLRGFQLHGKQIGVIGTGRIGRRVIEIAMGFGMSVVAYDLQPDHEAAQQLGFRYTELDDLLRSADIVTLHVPALPETINLLSDHEFQLMKPGVVLINTARGNVIDVPALVRALADGKVKAAGLDVLPNEPLIREEAEVFRADAGFSDYDLKALVANNVLLRFPNVIVTPHNAYNTDDAVKRIIETTLDNIQAFAIGDPQNVVV